MNSKERQFIDINNSMLWYELSKNCLLIGRALATGIKVFEPCILKKSKKLYKSRKFNLK